MLWHYTDSYGAATTRKQFSNIRTKYQSAGIHLSGKSGIELLKYISCGRLCCKEDITRQVNITGDLVYNGRVDLIIENRYEIPIITVTIQNFVLQ